MANVQSDLAISRDIGDHGAPKGVVLAAKAEYTIPASNGPGAGETLELMPLPKGAELLDFNLEADNGTATMTIDVGDGTTADKFLAGQNAAAAFMARMASGAGTAFAAAGSLFLTFGTAAPTAGHKYTMTAQYRMG